MLRKPRVELSVLLGLLLSVGVGCASMQKGESVVKWTKGEPVRMAVAPADGTYALYSGTDLVNAQIQYPLKEGDQLGFTQDDNGQVWAVAGSHREKVETGTLTKSYYWRKVK
jgi:hypothetical protein